jgi:hypothetical protein
MSHAPRKRRRWRPGAPARGEPTASAGPSRRDNAIRRPTHRLGSTSAGAALRCGEARSLPADAPLPHVRPLDQHEAAGPALEGSRVLRVPPQCLSATALTSHGRHENKTGIRVNGASRGGVARASSLDVVCRCKMHLETAGDVPRPFTENESSLCLRPRFAG